MSEINQMKKNMTNITDGNYIAVYTDGSSLIKDNTYYEASSAVIIVINGEIVHKLGCYHNNGTNSIGEIYAMMLAIEKVEELKRNNPELKDYFTFFVSDSKYVVSTLNDWVYKWAIINKNNDLWISSSNKPVMYQKFIKYIYYKYLINDEWKNNNMIIHVNGHIKSNQIGVKYKKALIRNNKETSKYKKFITLETFKNMVMYNHIADSLAEKIRNNKDFYYEERNENSKWVIRKRNTPVRNGRIVVLSRKNLSKI